MFRNASLQQIHNLFHEAGFELVAAKQGDCGLTIGYWRTGQPTNQRNCCVGFVRFLGLQKIGGFYDASNTLQLFYDQIDLIFQMSVFHHILIRNQDSSASPNLAEMLPDSDSIFSLNE